MTTNHFLLTAVLLIAASDAFAQDRSGYADDRRGYRDRGSEQIALPAQELSQEAMRLNRLLRRMSGYSHLADEAQDLSRSAERFHQVVVRGASPQQIRYAFRELRRDYTDLRSSLLDVHRRHQMPAVTRVWSDVAGNFETLVLSTGIDSGDLCEPMRNDRWDDRRGWTYER